MSGRHLRPVVWLLVTTLLIALLAPAAGAAPATGPLSLQDALRLLQGRGVLPAETGVNLRLNDPITRAEMAQAAVLALGEEGTAVLLTGSAAFPDTARHWASGYIAAAQNMGLVRGTPDGLFHPDAPMSGAEVLALLLRVVGKESAIQGPWPGGVVEAAARVGLVPATLDPATWQDQPLPRGVALYMLASAISRVAITPDGQTVMDQVDARLAGAENGESAGPGQPEPAAGEQATQAPPRPEPQGEPARIALTPARTRAVAGGFTAVPIAVEVVNSQGGPAAGGPFTVRLQATGPEIATLEKTQVQLQAGEQVTVNLTARSGGGSGAVTIQATLQNPEGIRGYTVVRYEPAALAAVRLEALPATLAAGGPATPLRAVALDQDGQPFAVSQAVTITPTSSDPAVAVVEGGSLTIPAGGWESTGSGAQVRPVALFGETEIEGGLTTGLSGVQVMPARLTVAPVGPVAGLRMTTWTDSAPADGVSPLIVMVERVDELGQPVAGDTTPIDLTSLEENVELEALGNRGGIAFYAARSAVPGPVTFVAVARDNPALGFADATARFRPGPTTRVVLRADKEELVAGSEATTALRAYLEDAGGNPVRNQGLPLEIQVAASGSGELSGERLIIPPGADRSSGTLTVKAGEKTGTLRLTGTAPRGLAVTEATVAMTTDSGVAGQPPAGGSPTTPAVRLVAIPDLVTARAGEEIRVRVEARDKRDQRVTGADYAFQVRIKVDGRVYEGDPDRLRVTLGGKSPVDPGEMPAYRESSDLVVGRTTDGEAVLYVRYEGTGTLEVEPLGRPATNAAYDDTGMAGYAGTASGLQSTPAQVRFSPGPLAAVRAELTPNLGDPTISYLKAAPGRTATLRVVVEDAYGNRVTESASASVSLSAGGSAGVSELLSQGRGATTASLNLSGGQGSLTLRVVSETPGVDQYTVNVNAGGQSWSRPFTVATVLGAPPRADIASVYGDVTREEGLVSAQDTALQVELVQNPAAATPANKVLFYVDGQRVGEAGPVYLDSDDPADRTVSLDPALLGRSGGHRLEVRLDNGAEVGPLSGAVPVVYDQSGPAVQVAEVHVNWAARELVLHGRFPTDRGVAVYPGQVGLRAGTVVRNLSPETRYLLSRDRLRFILSQDDLDHIAAGAGSGGTYLEAQQGWFVDARRLAAVGFSGLPVSPVVNLTRAEYSPGNQTLTLIGDGLAALTRVDPRRITLVDTSGRRYTLTTPAFTLETGETRLRIALSTLDNAVLKDPARLSHVGLQMEAQAGWAQDAAGYQAVAASAVAVGQPTGLEAAYYDALTGQLVLQVSEGFLDQGGEVMYNRISLMDADGSPRYTLSAPLAGNLLWQGNTLMLTLSPVDRDRINNAALFPAADALLTTLDGWYVNPSGRQALGTAGLPLQPWARVMDAAYHPATAGLLIKGEELNPGSVTVSRLFLGGQPLTGAEIIYAGREEVALRLPPEVVAALEGVSAPRLEADTGWLLRDSRYGNRGFILSGVVTSTQPEPLLTGVDVDYLGKRLILQGTGLPTRAAEWDLSRMELQGGATGTSVSLEGASVRYLSTTRVELNLTDGQVAALGDAARLGVPPLTLAVEDGWVRSTRAGIGRVAGLPVAPLGQVLSAEYKKSTGELTLIGTGLDTGLVRSQYLLLSDNAGGTLRLSDAPLSVVHTLGAPGMERLVLQLRTNQREALNLFADVETWKLVLEAGWLATGNGGTAPPAESAAVKILP